MGLAVAISKQLLCLFLFFLHAGNIFAGGRKGYKSERDSHSLFTRCGVIFARLLSNVRTHTFLLYDYRRLIRAIDNAHLDAVKQSLADGADSNWFTCGGRHPLCRAVQLALSNPSVSERVEIVASLLDAGSWLYLDCKEREQLLHMAATRWHRVDIVDHLFKCGVLPRDRYHRGLPILSDLALFNGSACMAIRLLAYGADPNRRHVSVGNELEENDGDTPLHYAVLLRRFSLALFYLAHSDDPNMRGRCGRTPLHCAASVGAEEMVSMLAKAGAYLNARNDAGDTPLHTAVRRGRIAVVQQLLAVGADCNVCDENKMTSLHIAAEKGRADIVRLLLTHDANPSLRDDLQRTPLRCALGNKFSSIAGLIRKWVGDDESPRADGGCSLCWRRHLGMTLCRPLKTLCDHRLCLDCLKMTDGKDAAGDCPICRWKSDPAV